MEHQHSEMTKTTLTNTKERAPHFVLIHGSCHGSWCWYRLRCLLESAGHQVTCLDLASSGIEPSDADRISNFDEYNKPLFDFMASLSNDQKVILVGHSVGGLSLTKIIHKFPEKIQAAVFLAGVMLKFGYQTDQDVKDGAPDGEIFTYGYELGVDQPATSVLFKKERLHELLYNMSPLEDVTLARMLLRPGPIRALLTAKFEAEGGNNSWERVPRVYIKTLHDRVLVLEQQESMINRWSPSQVYEIESDHSAFFSKPSALFDLLVKVAVAFT